MQTEFSLVLYVLQRKLGAEVWKAKSTAVRPGKEEKGCGKRCQCSHHQEKERILDTVRIKQPVR